MNTIKRAGLVLLIVQCLLNILTVAIFLFAPSFLRLDDGRFSMAARILICGGGLLAAAVVGIFGYATHTEQTYEKAAKDAPEGGKVAQRDLTLATVGFVSEMLALYWIMR